MSEQMGSSWKMLYLSFKELCFGWVYSIIRVLTEDSGINTLVWAAQWGSISDMVDWLQLSLSNRPIYEAELPGQKWHSGDKYVNTFILLYLYNIFYV